MDTLKGTLWTIVGVVTLGLLCLTLLQIISVLPYFLGEKVIVVESSAYLLGHLTGSIVMFIILIWGSSKAWMNAFRWFHHEMKGSRGHGQLIKH